ncbi:MAG: type IV secretion system DNA-binding domain-containing protein [Candidatus Pacebacteria bacterium]|nr:type IV secretion system DNA-binding domain-containing protein [Candidatus Paceibacterota bacterium]
MMQFDPEKITFFAKTDARGKDMPFGIKARDRQRHMYVIGKTGMGKSTLLENMAAQDIQNGEGMAFIDPHGSAAEKLLEYIPEHRVNDVVYFAPFDLDNPVSFNVMEDVGPDKRHLVVSGLMSTFKKIWVDAWSARMEYILTNALLALIEYPDTTLLSVNRLFSDKHFRNRVVDYVKDPAVKAFWVEEFAAYTDRFAAEALPAIQNKIGQFTGNPLIRNIIGQPHSSFDIRKIMDEKKILIINLSKGLVGDTNANLLGSMLTTRIYLAAMSRADLPPAVMKTMPNFYFYVDEFQSFANATFANILSEARKYHLNLIIAHQYIEQMEEDVRNAVFGNVGTTVAFRVGPFDAEVLETIFTPRFLAADLVNLGAYQIYLTLMIDGIGSQPFSAVTLPEIPPPRISCRDMVVAASRQNFAIPRTTVEKIISDLHTPVEPPPKPPKLEVSKTDAAKAETKPISATSSGTPKGDKTTTSSTVRFERPAPKPKSIGRLAGAGSSDRPRSVSTPSAPTTMVTADGLKAVLARIAASTNDTSNKKNGDKSPVSSRSEVTTTPASDHRSALRSVLGSVLDVSTIDTPKVTSVAVQPSSTIKSTDTAPAPVVDDSAYVPDTAEPDIKVLKKILGNDARVKSPF